MTLDFRIAELKSFLEDRLGFGLTEVVRLPGRSSSLNFVAVRSSDGFRFAIKCLHLNRSGLIAMLERLDSDLSGGRFAVRRLFKDRDGDFSGYRVLFYEYCSGDRPAVTDREWLDGFVDDYRGFSVELQKVSAPADAKPLSDWFRTAAFGLKGVCAPWIMRIVREAVETDSIDYDRPSPAVIHGDFHIGNLFFRDGRLSRVIDLESVARGYPTEDIVRFFTCLIEHCGIFAWRRRDRLMKRFAEFTASAGYSRREWIVALNGIILSRVATRGGLFGVGFREAIEEAWKIRRYRKLKEMVRA